MPRTNLTLEGYIMAKRLLLDERRTPVQVKDIMMQTLGISVGASTLQKIQEGTFKFRRLEMENAQFNKDQAADIQTRVDKEIEKVIGDKVSRNELLMEKADQELLYRVSDADMRRLVSTRDLVAIRDSSIKASAVMEGRPLNAFDEVDPQVIMQIANINITVNKENNEPKRKHDTSITGEVVRGAGEAPEGGEAVH